MQKKIKMRLKRVRAFVWRGECFLKFTDSYHRRPFTGYEGGTMNNTVLPLSLSLSLSVFSWDLKIIIGLHIVVPGTFPPF